MARSVCYTYASAQRLFMCIIEQIKREIEHDDCLSMEFERLLNISNDVELALERLRYYRQNHFAPIVADQTLQNVFENLELLTGQQ